MCTMTHDKNMMSSTGASHHKWVAVVLVRASTQTCSSQTRACSPSHLVATCLILPKQTTSLSQFTSVFPQCLTLTYHLLHMTQCKPSSNLTSYPHHPAFISSPSSTGWLQAHHPFALSVHTALSFPNQLPLSFPLQTI